MSAWPPPANTAARTALVATGAPAALASTSMATGTPVWVSHYPPQGTEYSPTLLKTSRPSVLVSLLPPLLPLPGEVPTPLPPSTSAALPTSPVDLPSLCWHQEVPHEHGSLWMEPGCLQCACERGRVQCEAVMCQVTCSHPAPPKEGACCPSCTGCLYDGVTRVEGDVFPLSDENCTVCVCLAGNVSCISPECPPGPCPSPAQSNCCPCQPAGCHFHGQMYTEGAEFSLDGDDCTTCVCQGGEVECSFTPCPTLECPRDDWLLSPGQCCFTCREAAPVSGCFIDDNGVEFPIGQIWSPGDPCELCICQADGTVSCKRTDCLEMCPHPIRIPGQCCPDCSAGCTYSGRIFYNNETFPSVLDPCLSCICLLGSVACSPVDCTIFCTYPFHPEGECCPVCHDCNYEGRKVVNGQTFVPEGEPCIHCTCQVSQSLLLEGGWGRVLACYWLRTPMLHCYEALSCPFHCSASVGATAIRRTQLEMLVRLSCCYSL
uniref:von Willebrand factor C and EGF domains n=1 Tax=Sphenodon punctatus TaxID=8508 RepID=A0A8D0HSV1_SPHPU